MKTFSARMLSIFMIICITLSSCSSDEQTDNPVIGEWIQIAFVEIDCDTEIETELTRDDEKIKVFYADGRFETLIDGERSINPFENGTWVDEGNGVYRLNIVIDGEPAITKVLISFPDSETMEFGDFECLSRPDQRSFRWLSTYLRL